MQNFIPSFLDRRTLRMLAMSLGLFGLAVPAMAACVDGAEGPQRAKFEIFKAAILEGNFDDAAAQVDLGGKRKNNIRAGLTKLARANVGAFENCILLFRRVHGPNFVSEFVYYSGGGNVEYWLMLSGVQIKGETRLIDVVFSNEYNRFREWLQ